MYWRVLRYSWILVLECIAAYNIVYSNNIHVKALSLIFNLSVYCYNLYYGLRIFMGEKDTNTVAKRVLVGLKSPKREVDLQTYRTSLAYALGGMAIAQGSVIASDNILSIIIYAVSVVALHGQICAGTWFSLFQCDDHHVYETNGNFIS